jgi:hypothetical protein
VGIAAAPWQCEFNSTEISVIVPQQTIGSIISAINYRFLPNGLGLLASAFYHLQ